MKPLSDIDRAILSKRATGATFRAIADELAVKPSTVRRVVEFRGPINAKGNAMLAADSENIAGLRLTGGLSQRVYDALANAPYKVDVPDLDR